MERRRFLQSFVTLGGLVTASPVEATRLFREVAKKGVRPDDSDTLKNDDLCPTFAHYVFIPGRLEDQPLYSENEHGRIAPASLVKQATALAYYTYRPTILLHQGVLGISTKEIDDVEYCVKEALITSDNYAAEKIGRFLARTIGGLSSDTSKREQTHFFARRILMPLLRDIGLKNTELFNASGLDGSTLTIEKEEDKKKSPYTGKLIKKVPAAARKWRDWAPTDNNYTTVHDWAVLNDYIYRKCPDVFSIAGEKSVMHRRYNSARFNTNGFLCNSPWRKDRHPNVVSGKTGYIDEAGYNLTALVRSEKYGDMIVISVGNRTPEERSHVATCLINDSLNLLSIRLEGERAREAHDASLKEKKQKQRLKQEREEYLSMPHTHLQSRAFPLENKPESVPRVIQSGFDGIALTNE